MRVAVVYETVFGNTRQVAEAIAEGIRQTAPSAAVACQAAEHAEPGLCRADLLIVGSPTHFLGMPSARSRRMRRQQEDEGAWHADGTPPGVREWLDALPAMNGGHRAAAFDTRLWNSMPGSAARQIARALRRHGYEMAGRTQGFVVEDYGGPLAHGELERARAWGAELAGRLGSSAAA